MAKLFFKWQMAKLNRFDLLLVSSHFDGNQQFLLVLYHCVKLHLSRLSSILVFNEFITQCDYILLYCVDCRMDEGAREDADYRCRVLPARDFYLHCSLSSGGRRCVHTCVLVTCFCVNIFLDVDRFESHRRWISSVITFISFEDLRCLQASQICRKLSILTSFFELGE